MNSSLFPLATASDRLLALLVIIVMTSVRTPGLAPEDHRYVAAGRFLPRTTSSNGAGGVGATSRESLVSPQSSQRPRRGSRHRTQDGLALNKDLGISEPGKTPTQDTSDRSG